MKIKDGFIVRPVAGSYVVVAVGEKTVDFNGIMTLNETGYFLWQIMEKGAEKEELLKAITEEYAVEESVALADIERFMNKLEETGLVE